MTGRAQAVQWWVGTSGFGYDEWRPAFYPPTLPKAGMLAYYASRLPAVEVHNTFYRMPAPSLAQGWSAQVPATFRFAVKAPMGIANKQRLVDCGTMLARLGAALQPLGERLGCVWYAVPAYVRPDAAVLRDFLQTPQPAPAIAFEFADPAWLQPALLDLLADHGAAAVAVDRDGEPPPQVHRTGDFVYLRLRRDVYGADELVRWRERLAALGVAAAFVFCKHEAQARGPAYAAQLLQR